MTARQPTPIAALMQRLERAAGNERGLFMLRSDEAQAMLGEIRKLRANQHHRLEMYVTDLTRSLSFSVRGGVLLRSQITVNGRRLTMQAEADAYAWDSYGPDFHEHLKAELRRRLIEEIVTELDPEVNVERSPYPNPLYAPPPLRPVIGL